MFLKRRLGMRKVWPTLVGESLYRDMMDEQPTPHKLIAEFSTSGLSNHLHEAPQEINVVDQYGWTPSMVAAAASGKISHLKELLHARPKINIQSPYGISAIGTACNNGSSREEQAEKVILILRENPDLTMKTSTGCNMLHLAARIEDYRAQTKLMAEAVKQGVDINHRHYCGMTPLMYVVENCIAERLEPLNFLINEGADINTTDSSGINLLAISIRKSRFKMLSFFLERGTSHLQVDSRGYTVLHWTAQYPHLETLQILKAHGLAGVDAHAKDENGRTALDHFHERDHKQQIHDAFSVIIDQLIFGKQPYKNGASDAKTPQLLDRYRSPEETRCNQDSLRSYQSDALDDSLSEYESALEDIDGALEVQGSDGKRKSKVLR